MATSKLILVFLSIAISNQATCARILPLERKLQLNRYSSAVTKPTHQETRKISSENVSSPALKFEVDRNGVFTSPLPVSYTSKKESPLKAVVVILILVLISSAIAALIRVICKLRADGAGELRQIAEVAQHSELTLCKCNTSFALFPLPL